MLEYNCIECGKDCVASHPTINKRKYCSAKCQQQFVFKSRIETWLNGGEEPGIKVIRRYLKETIDSCSVCGINSWNGKSIVLEMEHIDGNSQNNSLENLTLMCPNCQSQTSTYKNRNKGNGRSFRRRRYAEGKSY